MSFAIGQRWLNHADGELGLGIVVESDPRRVTIHFPAVEEERTYASDNAPLTRLRLRAGDTLNRRGGGAFNVVDVHEEQELLIYEVATDDGTGYVAELDLDDHIDLANPRQRLLASQFDSHAAFSLRLRTCIETDRLQRSGLRGMLGTRTALLPHQLYIANEVGKRHAPRVLLADEVGLGKTIEAGMILHRQLLSGSSSRVLVIVPESLQFQWMVEMRRRFNLPFALYDRERIEESGSDNVFEDEQLVICGAYCLDDEDTAAAMIGAEWDLVIVDEAHRIEPTTLPFAVLERLALLTPGLLLLTATPEQVGLEAHFARLQLLDPDRFHDFEQFQGQESEYRQWSDLMEALDRGESPEGLPSDVASEPDPARQQAALLDRYGTGRVLFRNTRAAVGGFPNRDVTFYPLDAQGQAGLEGLYPDRDMDESQWLQSDPRVAWLVEHLKSLRPAKVLVICASADTALALEHHLQLRAGIRSAAFHEHLSLVERDRAAAYFAEADQGAQALICSEIGGEGRNFQFAQHLVLFDLPAHPDQLEQRIGRLDRIGQQDTIYLHVPVIEGSAQQTLMRWYHEGMDLFRSSCSAGDMILGRFRNELDRALAGDVSAFETLLTDTAAFTAQTRQELSEGRDRLLERSSCDPVVGAQLVESIKETESAEPLASYLEELCAVTGVEHEEQGESGAILRRGEQELLAVFPELEEDGATVTVAREEALQREDWMFLGWEHPWMDGAMETVLASPLGQAAVGAMSLKGVPAGSRLYELIFTVSLNAPRHLGVHRYLPLSPTRVLLDAKGRDLSDLLPHDRLSARVEKLPRGAASKIVKQLRDEIEARLSDAESLFQEQLDTQITSASEEYRRHLDNEISRLEALAEANNAIRSEEIEALRAQRDEGIAALSRAGASLQGARLVLTR